MLGQNSRTNRFALRPDVVATVLDDGAVLLDLDSKYFYRLNGAGWRITQCFELGATLDEVKAYCKGLGASAQDDASIGSLLDVLIHDRLIELSDDGGTDISSAAPGETTAVWSPPTIEKQAEPLQRVIISAFDPSVPLVE